MKNKECNALSVAEGKTYETYKNSGIEWIGEVPEHWEINKVKHNFSFQTGFTPPSGKKNIMKMGSILG